MTLNNIIDRLQTLAQAHKQIKKFYIGDVVDFLTLGDVEYPACFIEFNGGNIGLSDRQTSFAFKLWFCDLENIAIDSQSNGNELYSDLTQIAQDYIAMLDYEARTKPNFLLPSQSFRMNFFNEKFEDLVCAVSLDIEIATTYAANRCQVPATDYTFTENNKMVVQNYTYVGVGNEGQSVTFGLLANKELLLVYKGDKLLQATTGTPTVNQYKYTTATGLFSFGNDVEQDQIIQILWKNI